MVLLVLLYLFLLENVCSMPCSLDQLNQVKLDRPGYAGKLQICLNTTGRQSWKNLCHDSYGFELIANLACRTHLGYNHGGEKIYLSGQFRDTITITDCIMPVHSLQECRIREYRNAAPDSDHCDEVLGVICYNSSQLPIANQLIPTPVITPTSSCHQQTAVVTTTVITVNSSCSVSNELLLNSSQNKAAHSCTPQNSMPNTKGNNGTILAGALGGVLGTLVVIMVIGLCVGLFYYRNKANSYRMTIEKTTNSQLENPVYAAPPASVNHQQITTRPQDHSEMNNNHYQIEEDTDYHVLEDRDYHVLDNPTQSKQHVPVINYEGFREDSVSVQSYEVPVSHSQENDRQ